MRWSAIFGYAEPPPFTTALVPMVSEYNRKVASEIMAEGLEGWLDGYWHGKPSVISAPNPMNKVRNEANRQFNVRYGHKPDCLFGTKNSGMCDCGKGFPPRKPADDFEKRSG